MRDRRCIMEMLRELRLSRDERWAARSERLVEREMRRQRDNEQTSARRAAALQAESRRNSNSHGRT